MSDGIVKAFIVCGCIAAGLNGVVTALVVAGGPAAGQAVAYAVPALYLALAYGIAKRSRICANSAKRLALTRCWRAAYGAEAIACAFRPS